jgi:hypothetical protein
MITEDAKAINVALLAGYSSWPPSAIIEHISAGGSIGEVPGDFVVGNAAPHGGWAISSCVSAVPWYWAVGPKQQLIQGGSVFDVAARAHLAWKWNFRAVQCLALYGHTVGDDTLHPDVKRMPDASRLRLDTAGAAQLEPLPYWEDLRWDSSDNQEAASQALLQAFRDCAATDDAILSLSSGYDSRVLLALCLHEGLKPRLSVMGSPDNTDVEVACKLAEAAKLCINCITLSIGDYVRYGREIARVTSGTKTAVNWHTWLYGLKLAPKGRIHLVGSNGEFARSFYFSQRQLAPLLSHLAGNSVKAYLWARLARRYFKFSKHNDLARHGGLGQIERLASFTADDLSLTRVGFMAGLDQLYARTRVRHFIAAGLACYATYSLPRSPFLDGRPIRAIALLQRKYKLDNRFHRHLIAKYAPVLMSLPFNQSLDGGPIRAYQPFVDLIKSEEIREMIIESSELDAFLSRRQRVAITGDRTLGGSEDLNFLLTLHFASAAAREHAQTAPAGNSPQA